MNPLHIAFLLVIGAIVVLVGIWQEQRAYARNRWMP